MIKFLVGLPRTTLAIFLYICAPPIVASAASDAIGFLDGTETMGAIGWAFSPLQQDKTLSVELYIDGPFNTGTLVGIRPANNLSPDLNEGKMAIHGPHRFRIPIPVAFRDAKSHTLYAYIVHADGVRTPIGGTPKEFIFACSVLVCTNIRIAADGPITMRAIGRPEIVYDHAAYGCEDDLPDVPPRAFRDAAGNVQFISSQITTYRMTGSTLNDLRPPDCQPIMSSREDRNPSSEAYHEWIGSVSTVNGSDVYALVHNEWYPSLIDHRCNAKFDWRFRINSITLATSHDGGRTFRHPLEYKLFRPGSAWKSTYFCSETSENAVFGPAEPTNVLRRNGFYYMMFHQGIDPGLRNKSGVCLARTPDIKRASSWTLWTNHGWVDGLKNLCDPISEQNIGDMHSSITFNTYLGKYLLVGSKYYPFDGVYISTSEDLIHWAKAVKILSLKDAQIQQGEVRYPVLLDPADMSRNFEHTGQTPYLYMVLQHDGANNIDIIRQKIMITDGNRKQ